MDTMVQPRLTDALSYRKVISLFFIFVLRIYFLCMTADSILFLTFLQIEVAQDLRGILIRIGRFRSLEQHYTKVHLTPIKKLWDEFDYKHRVARLANEKTEVERMSSSNESHSSTPAVTFSSWLPSFYDELLLYLEQEWKWYSSCSQHKTL